MLSQKNRRFLIVWFCVSFFALVCNIGPIRGQVKDGDYYINILSNGGEGGGFWPFISQFLDEYNEYSEEDAIAFGSGYTNHGFNGIFNGYSYLEFVIYGIIGIAIIILPKLWN